MPQYIGSTTPLTGSASYTSHWTNTDVAPRLTGSVFADQSGTIYIEQSGDGITADVSASYTVTASTGEGFAENIVLPYARIRYVNGSSAQGTFRLISKWIVKGN